ncbi:hypothetical protein E8E14_006704 [Neopestalotiopsis sp. 37M]|nr:hypothetical protein E8E14_006704 [Neopestalotiopsis sp. 37M]
MSLIFSTAIGIMLLPWTLAYPAMITAAPTFPALPTVPTAPAFPELSTVPAAPTFPALPSVPAFPSSPKKGSTSKKIERRFTPGRCGVHVHQYQKNAGPGGNTADYRFDVYLYDGAQAYLGGRGTVNIPSGSTADIGAIDLPFRLLITAGYVDADPLTFAYAGQHWSSNSGQCSVGAYDSGDREMDCAFTC